eukprot:TRINITY_DN57014_c0_g1_i1.p1 TRINITY_DN57014_c0_g1~~TRINITY_DN57014_c0_g1_i1.p1  ORF type:complete len:137 (+),score=14.86 TRINITY_DN57014_c0_g1_i1:162-572(+)
MSEPIAEAAPAEPSLKDKGNAEFKAGNYLKAAALYTQAIKESPDNPTLYSNRAAAFLHLSKLTKALADSETAIKLNPTWEKGYYRKGCVLEAMKRYEESLESFKEAASKNASNTEVAAKLRLLTKLARDQKRSQNS